MTFTLFAAFIFFVGWMSVVVADAGRPVNCCKSVTNTMILFENIVGYYIEDRALCSAGAIRFHTKKNKTICVDPDSKWAKKAKAIMDRTTTTTKPTMCYTSTTNLIPTTATTDKTQQTETETSMRTKAPPIVMTIKTSGLETSTSTTVPPVMITIKTSAPETKISKTSILPISVSKDIPELTVITCGTGETTAPPTETTTATTSTTRVINTTKKLSKMMKKRKGKSKKGLRKIQMGILDKPGQSV